jgi:radical SAM superfamily enzyme YgiQ (UPF0313 family)
VQFGFLTHGQVERAAARLASSPFGSWTREQLARAASGAASPPDVVGLSLLHAGQVLPAAAASRIARQAFPNALVVWGGPHVSGIGRLALEDDADRRAFAADAFVVGHAEQTIVDVLDRAAASRASSRPWTLSSRPKIIQGVRGASVVPSFDNLALYDDPPVLPAQSALGCAYGRCAFCTYPAMEPTPTKLDLSIAVDSVVELAQSLGGTVAVKDSLVAPPRLREIGSCVGGRVGWSACTKLHRKLDREALIGLRRTGLRTLEVGLESLLPETQRRVNKVHDPPNLFETFLGDVAGVPGLSLVANYMTGFPWEDEGESQSQLEVARRLVDHHLGPRRGKVEHNRFELERLSPMARNPDRHGIDGASLKSWPWASVVEFEAASDPK